MPSRVNDCFDIYSRYIHGIFTLAPWMGTVGLRRWLHRHDGPPSRSSKFRNGPLLWVLRHAPFEVKDGFLYPFMRLPSARRHALLPLLLSFWYATFLAEIRRKSAPSSPGRNASESSHVKAGTRTKSFCKECHCVSSLHTLQWCERVLRRHTWNDDKIQMQLLSLNGMPPRLYGGSRDLIVGPKAGHEYSWRVFLWYFHCSRVHPWNVKHAHVCDEQHLDLDYFSLYMSLSVDLIYYYERALFPTQAHSILLLSINANLAGWLFIAWLGVGLTSRLGSILLKGRLDTEDHTCVSIGNKQWNCCIIMIIIVITILSARQNYMYMQRICMYLYIRKQLLSLLCLFIKGLLGLFENRPHKNDLKGTGVPGLNNSPLWRICDMDTIYLTSA